MAEGKGLSKGCMAGLIVAGVLIVLAIIVIALGYAFWDDIVKMGSGAMVTETKRMVNENPPEGVDTTEVNAVLDGFAERFATDSTLSAEQYGPVFKRFQEAINDETITADEWHDIREDIFLLYPDMESLVPMEEDMEMMSDSAAMMNDSM